MRLFVFNHAQVASILREELYLVIDETAVFAELEPDQADPLMEIHLVDLNLCSYCISHFAHFVGFEGTEFGNDCVREGAQFEGLELRESDVV